jgi:hypothetical protein
MRESANVKKCKKDGAATCPALLPIKYAACIIFFIRSCNQLPHCVVLASGTDLIRYSFFFFTLLPSGIINSIRSPFLVISSASGRCSGCRR